MVLESQLEINKLALHKNVQYKPFVTSLVFLIYDSPNLWCSRCCDFTSSYTIQARENIHSLNVCKEQSKQNDTKLEKVVLSVITFNEGMKTVFLVSWIVRGLKIIPQQMIDSSKYRDE